jgi:hypothetical protein
MERLESLYHSAFIDFITSQPTLELMNYRLTVYLLRMNNEERLCERAALMRLGRYPR